MFGDRGRQSAREAEKRRRSPRGLRTGDGTAEDPRRTSQGPGTAQLGTGDSTAEDRGQHGRGPGTRKDSGGQKPLQVRGGYVAGPGNVWGPGTTERTKGRKASQVPEGNADRGRYGRGPATHQPRTGDGTAEDPRRTSRGPATGISTCKDIESQVAGKAVAGPSNAWGPGTAKRTRGRKASQVTKGNADRGRCG